MRTLLFFSISDDSFVSGKAETIVVISSDTKIVRKFEKCFLFKGNMTRPHLLYDSFVSIVNDGSLIVQIHVPGKSRKCFGVIVYLSFLNCG